MLFALFLQLLLFFTGQSPRESVISVNSSAQADVFGTRGIGHIFFQTNPKDVEKELFILIVHENQFVVSARRIYELLQPPKPYQQWVQLALYSSLLKENEDYFFRLPGDGK